MVKITVICLFIVGALIASSSSLPAKGSTKASLQKKPACLKDCGEVYKPVCAGDDTDKNNISFGSECVLSNYNCENGKNLKIKKEGECPGGGGVRLS